MPSASRRSRQDIEILRILGAFGIVWFHAGRDTTGIGYGGLVAFLVLSTYFAAAAGRPACRARDSVASRARRLLAPWAFWMVVFGVRNHFFADRYVIETDRGWINGLLAGTNIHLWFLPFMFVVAVGLDLAMPRLPRGKVAWCAGLGAALVIALAVRWRPWAELHGYPTVQYMHAVPAVLVGILVANASEIGIGWAALVLAAVLGAAALNIWRKVDGVGATYLAGVAASSLCLLRPIPLPGWLRVDRVSACSFGVYLSHPLWLRLFEGMESVPSEWEAWCAWGAALSTTLAVRTLLPRASSWIS